MHFSDEHVWTRLVVDVVVKVVDDVVVIVVEVVEVVVVYTLYDTSSFDGWDYIFRTVSLSMATSHLS